MHQLPNQNQQPDQEEYLTKSNTLYRIYGIVFFVVITLAIIKNLTNDLDWLVSVIMFWLQTIGISTIIGFYFSVKCLLHDKGKRTLAAVHMLGYIMIAVLSYLNPASINELLLLG